MNSSQDSQLFPVLVFKNKNDILDYSKIVVPSSMRSKYWKYFGFPADEFNNIISRHKIVCSICGTKITYNRNTTNLQTHLNARHPEYIKEMFSNKSLEMKEPKSLARRSTIPSSDCVKAKRIKMEAEEGYGAGSIKSIEPREHPTGILSKTAVVEINEDTNSHDNDMRFMERVEGDELIEVLDVNNTEYIELNTDQFDIDTDLEQTSVLDVDDLSPIRRSDSTQDEQNTFEAEPNHCEKEVPASINPLKMNRDVNERSIGNIDIENLVTKFIITDLVTPDILDGRGFRYMISKLNGDLELPSSSKITRNITSTYESAASDTICAIQSILKNRNYSISLEKWYPNDIPDSVDGLQSISESIAVFVNYLEPNESRMDLLRSQILCVEKGPLNKHFWVNNIEAVLPNVSMCRAVVVNFELDDNSDITEYWKSQQIPWIEDFSKIIEIIINKCLAIDQIQSAFSEIESLLKDTSNEDFSDKPCIHDDFWLTKFEFIAYFLDKVDLRALVSSSSSMNSSDLVNTLQKFIHYAKPLKNCIEILSQEKQTQSSLMRPLAQQLVQEFYTDATDDDNLDCEIKHIVSTDLTEKVLNNWFLTVASFVDPRFPSLTDPDHIERIKADLERACNENEGVSPMRNGNTSNSNIKTDEVRTAQRKSGLSSFFRSHKREQKKLPKNRFDVEFRSYVEDVNVEYEDCPLTWWSSSEYIYPNLKRVVQQYQCVPCTLSEYGHSLKEKTMFFDTRKVICNDFERKLLWLYYNNEAKDA